jgi:hypothetical protein
LSGVRGGGDGSGKCGKIDSNGGESNSYGGVAVAVAVAVAATTAVD